MHDPTATAAETELPPHFEISMINQLEVVRNSSDLEQMKAIASELIRYNYGVRALVLQMVKNQTLR